MKKCHFSTDITEAYSCCLDGLFDNYGFPINPCPHFSCSQYKELEAKSMEQERARRNEECKSQKLEE